ncbi:MAG TPA: hypothetical protein PKD00_03305 [Burkholderiales bacterium]|mgnify:CR=1 FL=1|nr:hypothetical protein [Burkholderiales bacterium]
MNKIINIELNYMINSYPIKTSHEFIFKVEIDENNKFIKKSCIVLDMPDAALKLTYDSLILKSAKLIFKKLPLIIYCFRNKIKLDDFKIIVNVVNNCLVFKLSNYNYTYTKKGIDKVVSNIKQTLKLYYFIYMKIPFTLRKNAPLEYEDYTETLINYLNNLEDTFLILDAAQNIIPFLNNFIFKKINNFYIKYIIISLQYHIPIMQLINLDLKDFFYKCIDNLFTNQNEDDIKNNELLLLDLFIKNIDVLDEFFINKVKIYFNEESYEKLLKTFNNEL